MMQTRRWLREKIAVNKTRSQLPKFNFPVTGPADIGSEYWTYLLPRRVGAENAKHLTQARLPMGAAEAHRVGLVDRILQCFSIESSIPISRLARSIAIDSELDVRLLEKGHRRERDEADKPLDAYRSEELTRLHLNFYGFDPSYHVARYNFIRKVPKSRTPLTLARHRSQRLRTPFDAGQP